MAHHCQADGTSGTGSCPAAACGSNGTLKDDAPCCYIKQLPERLQGAAIEVARTIFPANAPGNVSPGAGLVEPAMLTLMTTKYWGPNPRTLTVSFIEYVPLEVQQRILSHMNAWNCGITFQLLSPGYDGMVRITVNRPGYWSYIGTDILVVPKNQPTMCLQGFNMNTPESEYKRVVRHETGHTLGFPHEHLRREVVSKIDRQKAIQYFRATNGWPAEQTISNVLTPLDDNSIMGTPTEVTSIMAYPLPGQIMIDGVPVPGGTDLTSTDYSFCLSLYPRYNSAGLGQMTTAGDGSSQETAQKTLKHALVVSDDWGPANDVPLSEIFERFKPAMQISAA